MEILLHLHSPLSEQISSGKRILLAVVTMDMEHDQLSFDGCREGVTSEELQAILAKFGIKGKPAKVKET